MSAMGQSNPSHSSPDELKASLAVDIGSPNKVVEDADVERMCPFSHSTISGVAWASAQSPIAENENAQRNKKIAARAVPTPVSLGTPIGSRDVKQLIPIGTFMASGIRSPAALSTD